MQRQRHAASKLEAPRRPPLNHQPKVRNLRAHWIEVDTRKLPVIVEANDDDDRRTTTTTTRITYNPPANQQGPGWRKASADQSEAAELGLCEQCYKIDLHEIGKTGLTVAHHISFCALAESARSCLLCHMLLKQAPVPLKEATFAYDDSRVITISSTNRRDDCQAQAGGLVLDKFVVRFPILSQGGNKRLSLPVQAQIIAGRESQAANSGNVIGRRAYSGSNVLCVVNWLAECLRTHRACHTTQKSITAVRLRPPRLLDLGCHSRSAVRLIDTDSGFTSPYLALIYNQGESKLSRTTTKNAQIRRQLIDIVRLPRVFRQALRITRELGFRYLWIEALCTITDLPQDIAKHVPRIGLIYQNATIALSALGVSSVENDMIRARSRGFKEVKLPYRTPDGVPLGHFYIIDRKLSSFEDDVLLNDGYSRSHSLQPRLLSPRILYFGAQQLFWQCHCGIWAESCSLRLPSSSSDSITGLRHALMMYQILPSAPKTTHLFPRRMPSSLKPEITTTMHDLWYRVISHYTLLTVNKDQDKGSGVAGIAYVLACASSTTSADKYLAGLWRNDILVGLLWSPCSFQSWDPSYITYPTTPRAPSWSWMSVNGHVTWSVCVTEPRRLFARVTATGSFYVKRLDQDYSVLHVEGKLARLSSMCGFRPEDLRYKQALRRHDLAEHVSREEARQSPYRLPHVLFDSPQIEELWEHMHGDGRPITFPPTEILETPRAASTARTSNVGGRTRKFYIFSSKPTPRKRSSITSAKLTGNTLRSYVTPNGTITAQAGADFFALLICPAGCPRRNCTEHSVDSAESHNLPHGNGSQEDIRDQPWHNNCGLGLGYALILWPSEFDSGMWRRVGIAQVRMTDYAAPGMREDQELVII